MQFSKVLKPFTALCLLVCLVFTSHAKTTNPATPDNGNDYNDRILEDQLNQSNNQVLDQRILEEKEESNNWEGTVSLIAGITTVTAGLVALAGSLFFAPVAISTFHMIASGATGLVFGSLSKRKHGKNKRAFWGKLLSITGLVAGLGSIALWGIRWSRWFWWWGW